MPRSGRDDEMSEALPAIPVVDIRQGGPADHVRRSAARARALRDACLGFFPRAALLWSRRSMRCRDIR